MSTRRPSSDESASPPTAATVPQTSAPCTLGKETARPLHAASASSAPVGASPQVASAPAAEYHAVRVLTSVLLSPHAPTRTSTWSGPARGSGQSSRNSNRSRPPCPVRTTARMTAGRSPGECHPAAGAMWSETVNAAPGRMDGRYRTGPRTEGRRASTVGRESGAPDAGRENPTSRDRSPTNGEPCRTSRTATLSEANGRFEPERMVAEDNVGTGDSRDEGH